MSDSNSAGDSLGRNLDQIFNQINEQNNKSEREIQGKVSNKGDDKKTIFRLQIFGVVSMILAILGLVFIILTIEDTKKCESKPNLQCPCFTNPDPGSDKKYSTMYTEPDGRQGALNCNNQYN